MKHQVGFELDLTNPEEANLYNTIRNIDSIKNAISGFKGHLQGLIKDIEQSKDSSESPAKKILLPKLSEIISTYEATFNSNGITVW